MCADVEEREKGRGGERQADLCVIGSDRQKGERWWKKKNKRLTATRGNLDDANDAREAWGGWWVGRLGGGFLHQMMKDSLNGSIAVAIIADCRGVTLNFPLLFYIFGLRSQFNVELIYPFYCFSKFIYIQFCNLIHGFQWKSHWI